MAQRDGETSFSDGKVLVQLRNGVTFSLSTPEEFNWAAGGAKGHMLGSDGLPYAITKGKYEPTWDTTAGQEEGFELLQALAAVDSTVAALDQDFAMTISYRRARAVGLTVLKLGGCQLEDISQALKSGEGNRIPLKGKFKTMSLSVDGGAAFNPMAAA